MKARTIVVIGVLVFLWSLLMHAPAASLYGWLSPPGAPVQLSGIDGDLDQGKLQSLALNGRPLLQNLRWSFQPWWLPLLRLSFHVDGGTPDLGFSGRAARTLGGIDLSGVQLQGGMKSLLGVAGMPFVPMDGRIQLDLHGLKLRNNFPSAADGTLEAHGLAWSLGQNPMPLGDFKATLSTVGPPAGTSGPDSIKAVIATLSGPLDASGEVHLQADHGYDYDLQVKAKDNADPNLSNMLQSLGQPDTNGYYHLRNRGKL
jgi:general secretion pathway protein N